MIEMSQSGNNSNRRMIREQFIKEQRIQNRQHFQRIQNPDDHEDIFNINFNVDKMTQPTKYLPKNQQENLNEQTCLETCLNSCGVVQICCSHLCACCCWKCFVYQLPSSVAGLVEKFGKFHRLLRPGFNFVNPCSQEVHEVDLKIRIIPIFQSSTITKDNVEVKIKPSVAMRITNPVIAHYILGQAIDKAVSEVVVASIRGVVGEYTLDYVFRDRLTLLKLVKERSAKMVPNGIQIQEIFIEDISIPLQMQKDLSSLARSKRLAQAMLIENKGDVEAAQLMKQTAQLLDSKAAMQIRYLQLVQSLKNNQNTLLMDIGIQKGTFSKQKYSQTKFQ